MVVEVEAGSVGEEDVAVEGDAEEEEVVVVVGEDEWIGEVSGSCTGVCMRLSGTDTLIHHYFIGIDTLNSQHSHGYLSLNVPFSTKLH